MKTVFASVLLAIVLNGNPPGIFAEEAVKRFILVSGEEQEVWCQVNYFP